MYMFVPKRHFVYSSVDFEHLFLIFSVSSLQAGVFVLIPSQMQQSQRWGGQVSKLLYICAECKGGKQRIVRARARFVYTATLGRALGAALQPRAGQAEGIPRAMGSTKQLA